MKKQLSKKTTSYGIGQLINSAIAHGVKTVYISIDNFYTLDLGIGMAQALGFSFKDENFKEIGFGLSELNRIKYLGFDNVNLRLFNTEFKFFSKKREKLTGFSGYSYINRNSLNLSSLEISEIDKILKKASGVVEMSIGERFQDTEYSGAGGGLGFMLMALLNASHKCGIIESIDLIGLEDYIADSNLVITGDENLDFEKELVSLEVLSIASKYNIPVVAISPKISRTKYSNLNLLPITNGSKNISFNRENVERVFSMVGKNLAINYMDNMKNLH